MCHNQPPPLLMLVFALRTSFQVYWTSSRRAECCWGEINFKAVNQDWESEHQFCIVSLYIEHSHTLYLRGSITVQSNL